MHIYMMMISLGWKKGESFLGAFSEIGKEMLKLKRGGEKGGNTHIEGEREARKEDRSEGIYHLMSFAFLLLGSFSEAPSQTFPPSFSLSLTHFSISPWQCKSEKKGGFLRYETPYNICRAAPHFLSFFLSLTHSSLSHPLTLSLSALHWIYYTTTHAQLRSARFGEKERKWPKKGMSFDGDRYIFGRN